jgi:hypothetical protein
MFAAMLAAEACSTTAPTESFRSMSFAVGNADIHSRSNLVWDDLVVAGVPSAGIRGDGRNRYGQTAEPLNEYQAEFCGVRGFLYDGRGESGNLDFDPDTYYDAATMASTCGSARVMNFNIGSATAIAASPTVTLGPHVIVAGLWQMMPGQSRLQPQTFGMQGGFSCRLDFDAQYTGASKVRVTRLADVGGVRQWRLESQGNHVAACVTQDPKSGKWKDTGVRYYLPFAATITQVPYPFAVYP